MTINVKYQNKLVVSSVVFVLIGLVVFMFVFPFQKRLIESALSTLLETKKVVLELRQEQKNMELGLQDLSEMSKKELKPENFFSRDTTLVSEISNLEQIASRLSVTTSLSVSGTSKNGVKVAESKELLGIPYVLNLNGEFSDIVKFLEYMENSANLVAVRSVSLGTAGSGLVSATLNGAFYIKP